MPRPWNHAGRMTFGSGHKAPPTGRSSRPEQAPGGKLYNAHRHSLKNDPAGRRFENTPNSPCVILSRAKDPSGFSSVHSLGSFARLRMTVGLD